MKRRSFLGLLAGVFVAPKLGLPAQELATVVPEQIAEPAFAAFHPANNVFSTRIWAKALERDVMSSFEALYFGEHDDRRRVFDGEVGEMSSVIIVTA